MSGQKCQFSDFRAEFFFRADGEKATSRAELKILQLELWLEPARLGLITNYHNEVKIALNFFFIHLTKFFFNFLGFEPLDHVIISEDRKKNF